jgi:hypothetical protein
MKTFVQQEQSLRGYKVYVTFSTIGFSLSFVFLLLYQRSFFTLPRLQNRILLQYLKFCRTCKTDTTLSTVLYWERTYTYCTTNRLSI